MSARPTDPGPPRSEPGDTEQLVRKALHDHADEVEIRPDAYARLAGRVVEAQQSRGRIRSWFPPARIAIAAAVAVAAVAGGAALLGEAGRDRSQDVAGIETPAAEGGDATSSPTDPSVAPPADAGTAQGATPGGESPDAPDGAAPVGPVRETRLDAAEAFLDLIDVQPARAVEVGGEIIVRTTREGRTEFDFDIAVLELVEATAPGGGDQTGWAVAAASSSSVVIDRPEAAASVSGPSVEISGSGTGFEATLDVEVRSALDGSPLYQWFTNAGGLAEREPFTTAVDVTGWEPVWVVVRSAGGADDVASAFAAVPVTVEGPADGATYLVTGVALDDPDGGLNLRVAPGASSDRIAVLPWAEAVTRTPGSFPVLVGGDVWWPITAGDGTSGWVNARFLARSGEVASEELTTGAQAFLFAATEPDLGGRRAPISDRVGFIAVADGDIATLLPGALDDSDGWTDRVVAGASLVDLVSAPSPLAGDLVITPFASGATDGSIQDASIQETAARVFADLPGATVDYTGADGRPHRIHLFFEQAAVGPRIVGAVFAS